MPEVVLKAVVVGDSGVGKSSVAARFSGGNFDPCLKPTLGVSFGAKSIEINDQKVRIRIWDTSGRKTFDYIKPKYYNGAHGGFVVFDITQRKTFDNLDKWINEVMKHCGKIPMILVGNKADLDNYRAVTYEEAKKYSSERQLPYFETSAATGENLENIMREFSKEILKSMI